jgi:hypothetical protein
VGVHLADLAQRVEPADAGHRDVEQDQVRAQLALHPDRRLAVAGLLDAEALLLRDLGEDLPAVLVVVHDEG